MFTQIDQHRQLPYLARNENINISDRQSIWTSSSFTTTCQSYSGNSICINSIKHSSQIKSITLCSQKQVYASLLAHHCPSQFLRNTWWLIRSLLPACRVMFNYFILYTIVIHWVLPAANPDCWPCASKWQSAMIWLGIGVQLILAAMNSKSMDMRMENSCVCRSGHRKTVEQASEAELVAETGTNMLGFTLPRKYGKLLNDMIEALKERFRDAQVQKASVRERNGVLSEHQALRHNLDGISSTPCEQLQQCEVALIDWEVGLEDWEALLNKRERNLEKRELLLETPTTLDDDEPWKSIEATVNRDIQNDGGDDHGEKNEGNMTNSTQSPEGTGNPYKQNRSTTEFEHSSTNYVDVATLSAAIVRLLDDCGPLALMDLIQERVKESDAGSESIAFSFVDVRQEDLAASVV